MWGKIKEQIQAIGIIKIISFIAAIFLLILLMFNDLPLNESWPVWNLPLSGKIIILDPGHGGVDGGAVSDSGLVEKDITLNISKYLQDYLNEAGALVIMTREKDVDLADKETKGIAKRKLEDLQNRVRLVNDSMADFFISIHLNSIPSDRWHGAQTFYYPIREENEKMAKLIQQEIMKSLKNTDRIPLPRNDIMVLKYVDTPSVLVEAGFLSNPNEAQLLGTKEYQKKVAFAIYQGISKYYAMEEPERESVK
ncbi:N-acetylmuramoyl-L-alanine amidase CwlD [Tepidibacillus fermentans]|uniref:N-acetylmuramoyl-L-alanine amidase n=1 Tax=Tepidibacillus fermentans TaxID=1281767 RepID=A0A4R3KEL1_9BACI|nr:N-acetylmuramoyl-L-alanine amidase [Tepidibacillus fermentans]